MLGVMFARLERGIDLAAPGEGEVVGDDRILRDLFQRQLFLRQQRVIRRRDHAVVPFVAGQGNQLVVQRQAFGGDADVRLAAEHLLRDLRRAALVQAEFDPG